MSKQVCDKGKSITCCFGQYRHERLSSTRTSHTLCIYSIVYDTLFTTSLLHTHSPTPTPYTPILCWVRCLCIRCIRYIRIVSLFSDIRKRNCHRIVMMMNIYFEYIPIDSETVDTREVHCLTWRTSNFSVSHSIRRHIWAQHTAHISWTRLLLVHKFDSRWTERFHSFHQFNTLYTEESTSRFTVTD